MKQQLINFLPTEVAVKDGHQVFLWKLTPDVKKEIESLLNIDQINYAWIGCCEAIPQFECHECGQVITFADLIRAAIKEVGEIHTKELFKKVLEIKDNIGSGREHTFYCKNNHKQIPTTMWAAGFNWSWD